MEILDEPIPVETSQKGHTTEILFYSIAQFLQRAAHYAFRSCLVLFMVKHLYGFDKEKAGSTYFVFQMYVYFCGIIGGMAGDMVFGNRKTAVIGLVLQTLGSFILCIGECYSFYAALAVIGLGSGSYLSNIWALTGRSYYNKPELMEAGFNMLHIASLLGAILGPLLSTIFLYGDHLMVFALSGILAFVSAIFLFFPKRKTNKAETQSKTTEKTNWVRLGLVLLAGGLFWYSYGQVFEKIIYLESIPQQGEQDARKFSFANTSQFVSIIFYVISAIVLTFYFFKTERKFLLSLWMMCLLVVILIIVPKISTDAGTMLVIPLTLLLVIAEILFAPAFSTLITLNSNRKKTAISMGIATLISGLMAKLFDCLYDNVDRGAELSIYITAVMQIIATLVFAFFFVKQKDSCI